MILLLFQMFPRSMCSMLYCTTGILLTRIQHDAEWFAKVSVWLILLLLLLLWLASYNVQVSHIIVDEIHERDLYTDFLLIVLKDLVQRRKDIKVCAVIFLCFFCLLLYFFLINLLIRLCLWVPLWTLICGHIILEGAPPLKFRGSAILSQNTFSKIWPSKARSSADYRGKLMHLRKR